MDQKTEEVVSIVTKAFRFAELAYVVISPRKAFHESSKASVTQKSHVNRESLTFEWYGFNRRFTLFIEVFTPTRSTSFAVSYQGLIENFPYSDARWIDSETMRLYPPISLIQKTILRIRFLRFYKKMMETMEGQSDEHE